MSNTSPNGCGVVLAWKHSRMMAVSVAPCGLSLKKWTTSLAICSRSNALGSFAWDGAIRALRDLGHQASPKPAFGHLEEARVGPYALLGSYHPSQQNTFTGRLTPPMLDAAMLRARRLAYA